MKYLVFILLSVYCISCQNPTENEASYIFPIELVPSVEENIKAVYEDAKLLSIFSNSVTLDGKSKTWFYTYFSPSLNKNIYLHSTIDGVKIDSLSSNVLENGELISSNIIESYIVIDKAKENGLIEFIKKYPNYRIELTLYQPIDWDRPVWYLLSISNDSINNTGAVAIFGDTGEYVPIIE